MGRYEAKQNPLSLLVLSPKVKSGALWGIVALLVMAVLDGITPAMLGSLGDWEPIVRNVIAVVSTLLGAYLKTDPLRVLGAEVIENARSLPAVDEVPDVPVVAPVDVPVAPVAEVPVVAPAELDVRG